MSKDKKSNVISEQEKARIEYYQDYALNVINNSIEEKKRISKEKHLKLLGVFRGLFGGLF